MFREREAGKFCFAAAVTIHLTMHNWGDSCSF